MFSKTFAVATFAAVASAQLPAIARREFLIEARQTYSADDACSTAIASVLPIYSEIPLPPSELQSVSLPSDPCETPSFTGTVAAEYSSYTSEVLDWYTSHSDELLSALASCTDLAAYASEVPVCSTAASAILSSVSAIATEESSASATDAEGGATATGSGAAESSSEAGETGSSIATATATKSSAASGTSASTVATAGAARENSGFVAGIIAAAGVIAAVAAL
ncbi:hypothetical protein BKA67DRAFT_529369 [Truncatella angustata]|uniref:Infection structure specific protein n=1 Tax=Truncatella angustata TaxID=152316 RepID=A0A9P9A3R9_9PEZI|nr:uncharacterized protein BKA67DRAFT_529369 [Truncatella angustata]KAH6659194.1 hypothetical protein BKA67DRAFT_529369 [Truncatella angustata]KAH8193851.1 hypothetical protein TruAng_011985 [Truncatella angustata]